MVCQGLFGQFGVSFARQNHLVSFDRAVCLDDGNDILGINEIHILRVLAGFPALFLTIATGVFFRFYGNTYSANAQKGHGLNHLEKVLKHSIIIRAYASMLRTLL